jgi:hypothetical protein
MENCRPIERSIVDAMLSPYKEQCRYLKQAGVESARAAPPARTPVEALSGFGIFSIQESCYIQDTGHFNSVEFNICYNQLAYVTVADLTVRNLIGPMQGVTLSEFRTKQLPNMLIANFSSTFKRSIDARLFYGRFRIERLSVRKDSLYMRTHCSFFDDNGGFSDGTVLLALLNIVRGEGRSARREVGVDADRVAVAASTE